VILLINPPSPFLLDERVHPPLGLLYLATYLRDVAGIKVAISDVSSRVRYCPMEKVDLIGITVVTPQYRWAWEAYRNLSISYAAPVVIGGAHATMDPGSCTMFDHVVVGEGEVALADFANWRGHIVQYPFIEDIDTIPYPDRGLIDIDSYHYYIDGERATTVMTSRGCPYDCAFCCSPWGRKVRVHSPEYIVGEVQYIKQRWGYRAFMFFDDIFVWPRKRITKIAELLTKENIIYRCFVRSDLVNRELLVMLRESGCVEIGFGAESGCQGILDTVGKGNSVQRNTELVELARKEGIRTKAFLMVGLPGETHESCQETYDWIRNVAPDSWDICIYTPYVGSKITDNPSAYDIEIDYSKFEDLWYKGIPGKYHCPVSTSGLTSDEIIEWRDKIENELGGHRHGHPVNARSVDMLDN